MSRFVLFCFLILLKVPVPAQTQSETDELRSRIESLEQSRQEAYVRSLNQKGDVRAFLGDSILLGGFFDTGIAGVAGPDTKTQFSANAHVLGLNIAAGFTENVRFTTQLLSAIGFNLDNPHHDPNQVPSERQFRTVVFATTTVQSYLEYTLNDAVIVQAGLGYAPFGQAFQERELVLFRRRGGPQMISSGSTGSIGIADAIWTGAHLSGSIAMSSGRAGYNLYTHTPSTSPGNLGLGGRLWHSNSDGLLYGYSVQTGTMPNGSYLSHGIDLSLTRSEYGVIAEGALNSASSGETIAVSYYIEPYFTFAEGEHIVFVAADYLDHKMNSSVTPTGLSLDPIQIWKYGPGFNWLPLPLTRFRIAFLRHDYVGDTAIKNEQDRDYYSLDLSAGIAF